MSRDPNIRNPHDKGPRAFKVQTLASSADIWKQNLYGSKASAVLTSSLETTDLAQLLILQLRKLRPWGGLSQKQ